MTAPNSRTDAARALVLEQLRAIREDRAHYSRMDRIMARMFGLSIERARARARRQNGAEQ